MHQENETDGYADKQKSERAIEAVTARPIDPSFEFFHCDNYLE
jgi:hypothetical protein